MGHNLGLKRASTSRRKFWHKDNDDYVNSFRRNRMLRIICLVIAVAFLFATVSTVKTALTLYQKSNAHVLVAKVGK